MDVKKIPAPLLAALGLVGCGPVIDAESTAGSSASQGDSLSGPMTDSGPRATTSPPPGTTSPPPGTTSPPDITTGCLSPPIGTSSDGSGTSTGPGGVSFIEPTSNACLSIDTWTGTSTGTGTGTDTDTETSTGTGTGTGETGAPAPERSELLDRLEQDGVLPADLLERLRSRE